MFEITILISLSAVLGYAFYRYVISPKKKEPIRSFEERLDNLERELKAIREEQFWPEVYHRAYQDVPTLNESPDQKSSDQ